MDNLTKKFKEQLENRSKLTTVTPQRGSQSINAGQSLWETAGSTQQPDWLNDELGQEGDFSALRTAGIGLWGFLETGTLGLAGLGVRAVSQEAYKNLQPRNFSERVATGLGTVGGFIVPFGAAKAGVAGLLKGAKVVRDGKVVGYGAAKAGEKFINNASRVLKTDPAFKEWYVNQGLNPSKVNEWIKNSGLLQAPSSSIKNITRGTFGASHAARTQYAANVARNTEGIIRKKVVEMGKAFNKAGDEIPFDVTDKGIEAIKNEVTKYVGGKYNFPITNLHQYLSAKMGNTKLASIAASAAEEAILFSAVELPMNVMNSIMNEDVDFAPLATLGHSMVLGSALGVVRLIPGGRDMGIMKSAYNKASKMITQRKRYSSYNVNEASDRILLTERAKNLWDDNPEIFKGLAGTKLYRSGKKSVVSSREELSDFAASPESARELRNWMGSIEKAFYKDWWPGFLKDSGKDIFGSMPRMIAGSLAFNATLFNEYRKGNVPTEDMVFHTLLGAVMTKRGRDIEYIDNKGTTQLIPENRRPYIYDDSFAKVDSYLNSLGLGVDHAAFRNVMNNMETLKEHGKPDYSNSDMKKILQSLNEKGFVVDKNVELEVKNKNLEGNDVYNAIHSIMEAGVPEGKRLKQSMELSETELTDYLISVRDLELRTLKDFRTDRKNGTSSGIYSVADVIDVTRSSASKNIEAGIDIHTKAVIDAYNIMLRLEAIKEGGWENRNNWEAVQIPEGTSKVDLRPIRYDNTTAGIINFNQARSLFGNGRNDGVDNYQSALGMIKNRVNILSGDRNELVFDKEAHKKLFGDKTTDDRGEMDKFDRELTTQVFGEGIMSDDALLHVGDSWFHDSTQSYMFVKGVRDTWLQLEAIRDKDAKKSAFGDDVKDVNEAIDRIFPLDGALPGTIILRGAEANSREQLFASKLLEILKQDPERAVQRDDLGKSVVGNTKKTVDINRVKNLMDNFDKAGILDGFVGKRDAVDTFAENLAYYTRAKSLEMAVTNEGNPLTNKHLAILNILSETRLMGRNYDMVRLTDQIGNLKDFFTSNDIINKYNIDKNLLEKSFSDWSEGNKETVEKAFVDLKQSNENLYNLFVDAANKMEGVSGGDISMMLGNFLKLYEKTLAPLWKTTKGGVLKESAVEGAVTSDFLFKIVSEFNRIQSNEIDITHKNLLDSVSEVYYNTKSSDYKKFLATTINAFSDRKSDVTRVLSILEQYKIFDKKNNIFLFDEADKTLDNRIKEASRELEISTQTLPIQREIDILMERDKQDFNPKSHSDIDVSLTLEKFKSDWGLKFQTPDMEHGQTPASILEKIITESYSGEGGFTLQNFFDFTIKSGEMKKEIDGKVYTQESWKEMPYSSKERLFNDVTKIWSGIQEGVKTRQISAAEENLSLDSSKSARRNDLTDFLSEEFGEVVFIDPKFRDAASVVKDAREVTGELLVPFYTSVGKVGVKLEAKIATTDSEAYDYFAGANKPSSGYIVGWLGDLDSGVGIPILQSARASEGKAAGSGLVGADKLANSFVKTLEADKIKYSDNTDISFLIDRMLKQYVESKDSQIVEVFEIKETKNASGEIVESPSSYSFKGKIASDERTSQNASVMLTTVFGNQTFGKNFWKSIVNTKKDSKGWSSEKEFAHDFLRRVRLFTNRSTTNLSVERIKNITDFVESNFGGEGTDFTMRRIVDEVLKPINKTGKFDFHIIKDEAMIKGENNPAISSAFRNLTEQVKRARELNPDVNLSSVDSRLKYPGGLGDTSHFNSVIVVGKDFMEALKIITGDYHRKNSSAAKPIISFASDGNSAFLGKTMFMVDSRFEPYMKTNKINMVMFNSAIKTLGEDYNKSIIDLNDFSNMDAFLGSTNLDKKASLPIEAIQMQSWHAGDKPARIPMHVANDLAGQELNNSYFNWLNKPSVEAYEQRLSSIVGGGNISRMTAFSKFLIGEVGEDVDNVMYSTMSRWLAADGYPMFLPFKNSMRNAMMRTFIDKAGMISPENNNGSQSVLVPSYYEFDHKNGLRNILFSSDEKGNESVYSYGGVEIGMNNMYKSFSKDRFNIIVHRENAADQLIPWQDFISELRTDSKVGQKSKVYISKSAKDLNNILRDNLEGFVFEGKEAKTLKEVYDWLDNLNTKFLDKNVTAEIATVVQRTPSTRPSDKVIAGLKGFIPGNFARLNTVDLWTRLEADHDLDKVNYWWDTPTDILNAWDKMAPQIKSVVNKSNPTSISGLDILNPKSIVDYNFNSHKAAKKRGEVVKLKRVLQFMNHYKGADGKKGYNLNLPDGKIIRINPDRMAIAEQKTTEYIQNIVDSKDGWKVDDFQQYYRDILFGREDWVNEAGARYAGVFEKGNPKEGVLADAITEVEKDIIINSLQPYKGFLQLATDTYDGGEAKRIDYNSFISGFDSYRDSMRNLESYVLRSMRREGKYTFKDYRDYFYKSTDAEGKSILPRNLFGLQNAKMPRPARRGEQNLDGGIELLPFDRSIWASASVDRLSLSEPLKSHVRSEEVFEDLWSKHVDINNNTNNAVSKIVDTIKKDAKNIEFLNIIDRKLIKAKSGLTRAKRYEDSGLESWLQDRVDRLQTVRDGVNERILSDENTSFEIAKTIRYQLTQDIIKGNPVDLLTVYKDTQGNIKTGKVEYKIGPETTGSSQKARENWAKQNNRRIVYSTWQNNKLAIQIKGMNTNDYTQLALWHQTLAEKTGFILDPAKSPYSEAFEISIRESKRNVGQQWNSWWKNREYAPNEREDVVGAAIMRDIKQQWGRWNDVEDGLGNLWILKFMTPEPSGNVATYHNGKFMPGFRNVDKQVKYITLGLNFLSTNSEVLDIPIARKMGKEAGLSGRAVDQLLDKKQLLFRELAESFTDKMRVVYNQDINLQDPSKMSAQQKIKATTGNEQIDGSIFAAQQPLISGNVNDALAEAGKAFKAIDSGDIDSIQGLHPDMKLLYGITGDIPLDYLTLKGAPTGLDMMTDIRSLSQFYFMPKKALNNRGRLENIDNLKGYYDHVNRDSGIYFGEVNRKNLLIKEEIATIDMNPFGEPMKRNVQTETEALQAFKENVLGC